MSQTRTTEVTPGAGKKARPSHQTPAADAALRPLDSCLEETESLDPEGRLNRHRAMLDDPRFSPQSGSNHQMQIMTHLQNRYGNKYVQRLVKDRSKPVAPRGDVIQRQGGGPVKEAKTGLSVSVDVKKPIGGLPIMLQQITAGGEISGSVAQKGDSDSAKVSMSQSSLGVELEKNWMQLGTEEAGNISFTSKGEAEVKSDGAEVSLTAVTGRFGNISVGLKLVVFNVDWNTSKIDIAEVHAPVSAFVISGSKTLADGSTISYEAKYTLTFEFSIDYAKAARWIAKAFSKVASSEVALAGAFVAGGIVTIGAALVNIAHRDEAREWTDEAIRLINLYAGVFDAVLQGADWSVDQAFLYQAEKDAMAFNPAPPYSTGASCLSRLFTRICAESLVLGRTTISTS